MKHLNLLLLSACFLIAACQHTRKPQCSIQLTGIATPGDTTQLEYNPDGTLKLIGRTTFTYFNNGNIAEGDGASIRPTFDANGRLVSMKIENRYGGNLEQMRYYYYDNAGVVTRTKTNNAGNATDYLTDLTWQNGDVTSLVYTGAGGFSSKLNYRYYDTLCKDKYFSFFSCGQVGIVWNRHLIESRAYGSDSVHYAYGLNADGRVTAIYTNHEGPTWSGARVTDTTYCIYKCQ